MEFKLFIVFMLLTSMFIAGCYNDIEAAVERKQTLDVQRRIGEEDKYEVFNLVTDEKEVNKVKELIEGLNWETAKVSMDRPADYRSSFPNPVAKTVLYELWLSPDQETIELVITAESRYVKLEKDQSGILFELLTGKDLV